MRAPPRWCYHYIALGIGVVVGGDNLCDAPPWHHLTYLNLLGIRLPLIHATAHVRVKGEIEYAQQHAAGRHGGDRCLHKAEVLVSGPAIRSRCKDDLTCN